MAYVYTHTRIDNNEVFYVGISKFSDPYIRAYTTHKRNQFWKNIVAKAGGFVVTIIEDGLSWADACQKERSLISLYGRRDIKTGTLCNWTAGGEGSNGALVSEETKRKITLAKTGMKRPPITDEARKNLSDAMKGKRPKNFIYLHSPEIVKRRIAALKGSHTVEGKKKMSDRWLGANNPRVRRVVNTKTGEIFNSLKDAQSAWPVFIHHSSLSTMLSGKRKNYTDYAYTN